MKVKYAILILILANVPAVLNAQNGELLFNALEFDINVYQYPYMLRIKNPLTDLVNTNFTFTDQDYNFELRYALFSQTEMDAADIYRSFALFVIPIINGAAGLEVDLNDIQLYDEKDVAEEYNGDIGLSAFIPNPSSRYCSGYAFVLLNFFLKKNQGIVMQTILFDEIEFAGSEEFDEILHSFEFYD